jgi:hypothetical protein
MLIRDPSGLFSVPSPPSRRRLGSSLAYMLGVVFGFGLIVVLVTAPALIVLALLASLF